ncbi:MAG: hypothetical protein ACR2HG_00530 [Pyrinomonadaceae bacterium]
MKCPAFKNIVNGNKQYSPVNLQDVGRWRKIGVRHLLLNKKRKMFYVSRMNLRTLAQLFSFRDIRNAVLGMLVVFGGLGLALFTLYAQ